VYSCLDTPDMTSGIANMREEPTVETLPWLNRDFSNERFTLLIKGQVVALGKGSSFFKYGFYWSTNKNDLIDKNNLVNSKIFTKDHTAEIDTFSYELENLDGNQTYYWIAFAENQYGVAWGTKIEEYTTPSEKPEVASGEKTSSPTDGALLFTGEILSFGKISEVFEKGFYWGFDEENLDSVVFVENTYFEPDTFSYILSNVRGDTPIYWRAFARNDFGTSSGNILYYKTPPIFERRSEFSGRPRSNFTVFSLNNTLYLTCGYNINEFFGDVWRYYDGDMWRNDISDIPANRRIYPVAFTINDSLAYVGTGRSLSSSLGDFYVFNGNTNKWNETPIQTPSEMPRYEAVAFSLNNKGYVVGGRDESTVFRDVWEYSTQNGTDSWKRMNSFPELFYGGLSFYNKERVFAGFGNSSETQNTLWEYIAATDDWENFFTFPIYMERINSGVMTRDKIYLLDVTNIIWELDLATKMYKQKSTLPSDLNEQYMFSLGDVIYVGLNGTELLYRYYPLWDN